MKKFLAAVSTALLVVILALTLAGCDKSGSVEKAFKDNGFEVTQINTDNNIAKGIFTLCGMSDEQIEELNEYNLYLCIGGLKGNAVVVKFPSGGKLKDFLTVENDGEKNTEVYDKAKEGGYVNGNCYLLTLSDNALEIFKNA